MKKVKQIEPYVEITSRDDFLNKIREFDSNLNDIHGKMCILPFISVSSNPNGDFRVCGIDKLNDDNIPHMNKGDTFQTAFNSDHFKNIRKKFLNREWPRACHKCKAYEEQGWVSRRMLSNQPFQHRMDQIDKTELDGFMPEPIRYLDLKISNLCNLNCNICTPNFSSKHAGGKVTNLWVNRNSELIKEALDISKDVDKIFFTGGEPFLIKEYIQILNGIQKDRRKDIDLIFTTNGTKEFNLKLLSEFRDVYINVSLDDLYERCELLRTYGGYKFEKTIDLVETFAKLQNSVTRIRVAVYNWNVWHYPEIFLFWKERGIKLNHCFNILISPTHLNIQTLPLDFKHIVNDKFQKYMHDYKDNIHFVQALDGITSFMMSNNLYTEERWSQFKIQSFAMPNFYDVFSEFNGVFK